MAGQGVSFCDYVVSTPVCATYRAALVTGKYVSSTGMVVTEHRQPRIRRGQRGGPGQRLSEEAEIIVFERGPHVSFANCGLPYYVGGESRVSHLENRSERPG